MAKLAVLTLTLALLSATLNAANIGSSRQKNIIFILADDFGFNDPSFRGNNEILTPNLDALFASGVLLNRYYTHPLCSPTRSALLTGRYAHTNGMHHEVTWNHQPWGLGVDQKLFPQYLKEVGYETHIIGKWHLGNHQRQYFPTERGFDTFYGHLSPYVDYYQRWFKVPPSNFPGTNYSIGYDFYNNLDIDREELGTYITDLLTKRAINIIETTNKDQPFFIYFAHTAMHRANDEDPLPYKQADYDLYSFIQHPERRKYAAMVKALDDSIGNLIEALDKSGKLKDTIIAFTTDNGGPTAFRIVHPNYASNWPLRSCKGTSWEGGTRVNAAIYAKFLPRRQTRNQYFHVSDWLPTLATLGSTGIKFDRKLDGIDQSNMILNNQAPFRNQIETIDPIYLTTSLIHGDWKLMNSSYPPLNGLIDTWLGSNNNTDRDLNSYISLVRNSKVAQSLKHGDPVLKEKEIWDLRESAKTNCPAQGTPCNVLQQSCLYNIKDDPCERNNLANDPAYAGILQDLRNKLAEAVSRTAPPRNKPGDPLSDPALHGGVWTYWQPDTDTN